MYDMCRRNRYLPHSRAQGKQTLDFQIPRRLRPGGVRWCVPYEPQGGRKWSAEQTSLGSRCTQASASQLLQSYTHDLWGQRQGTDLEQFYDNHSSQMSPGEPGKSLRDIHNYIIISIYF